MSSVGELLAKVALTCNSTQFPHLFFREWENNITFCYICRRIKPVCDMKKIVNPWKDMEGYNCFGCAPCNEAGVKMEFYEDGDEVVCYWRPRPEYQGWFNTLHGGIQAVLLDEICAWVILRRLQTTGVTSRMETRYRKSVSTNDEYLVLRASVREQKRNLVVVDARLFNRAGELCTEAVCTYFTFSPEKAEKEMFFRRCDVEEEDVQPPF